jgi:hypothetical protein
MVDKEDSPQADKSNNVNFLNKCRMIDNLRDCFREFFDEQYKNDEAFKEEIDRLHKKHYEEFWKR